MGWCTLGCRWSVAWGQRPQGTSPDCLAGPRGRAPVFLEASWGAEDGAPGAGGVLHDTLAQPGAPEARIVTSAIRLQAQQVKSGP